MSLIPVKHRWCNTAVILKRTAVALDNDTKYPTFWCPQCKKTLEEGDLDRRGPYCVMRAEES